ncbi:MAG: MBL fold metallo-hydrolase [Alphaproteobacteria bacterium]|nr:MBL fold metallo-hydrolase [Alphaproteobacteria bacterium]
MLRWLGYIFLTLVVLAAGAYYWLIVENHLPSNGSYAIDMAEVRRLADSLPGDKPTEVRVETVASVDFPKAAIMTGDTWDQDSMPMSSYQLVYADRTVIIDTGVPKSPDNDQLKMFDADAYGRITAALNATSLIVITHEHFDHIGGLIGQPNLKQLLGVTKLTKEQIAEERYMQPLKWPAGALDDYQPFEYDHYAAVAPGVVLIKAPGHTPGSQLVYVKRADGAEMLFLGDVAWKRRNVEQVRQRARLVTWWFLNEDRDQVMLELAEFKRLTQAEPQVELMPGHDQDALDHFLSAGLLVKGFK